MVESWEVVTLVRIDCPPDGELYFCDGCAEDALESGAFRTIEDLQAEMVAVTDIVVVVK